MLNLFGCLCVQVMLWADRKRSVPIVTETEDDEYLDENDEGGRRECLCHKRVCERVVVCVIDND